MFLYGGKYAIFVQFVVVLHFHLKAARNSCLNLPMNRIDLHSHFEITIKVMADVEVRSHSTVGFEIPILHSLMYNIISTEWI